MNNNNYCLYCHTNKINGKKYFGITKDYKNRWGKNGNGYLSKNKHGNYVQPLFARAINKYTWNGFYHNILFDNLTLDEAKEFEIKYIKLYKTSNSKYGYNLTKGGDNTPKLLHSESSKLKQRITHTKYHVNQYSVNGQYIKTWYNMYDIHRELNISNADIHTACKKYCDENGIAYAHNYLWKLYDVNEEIDKNDITYIPRTNKKEIYSLDLNCNILKQYCSILDASNDLNISSGEIVAVCKNSRKSTHGYRFCYIEDYDNIKQIKYKNNKHRVVVLLDENKQLIKEYSMILEMSKDLNIRTSVIHKKLKSKTLYKDKYFILYKEDYLNTFNK